MNALQDSDVTTHSDYTTMSRNYKLGVAHENMQASIQGNVIFDPSSQLPREVLLETTLKAFGFNMDIWEVCNTEGHKKNLPLILKHKRTHKIFLAQNKTFTHYTIYFLLTIGWHARKGLRAYH